MCARRRGGRRLTPNRNPNANPNPNPNPKPNPNPNLLNPNPNEAGDGMWIDEVRSLGHDVGKARRALTLTLTLTPNAAPNPNPIPNPNDVGKARRATPAAVRGGNHGTRGARAARGAGAGAGGGRGAGGTRGAIRAPGVVTRERGAFGARFARRTRAVAGADRV